MRLFTLPTLHNARRRTPLPRLTSSPTRKAWFLTAPEKPKHTTDANRDTSRTRSFARQCLPNTTI